MLTWSRTVENGSLEQQGGQFLGEFETVVHSFPRDYKYGKACSKALRSSLSIAQLNFDQ
jgi:hypothetical protein